MSGQSSVRTLALVSEDAGLSTRQGDTLIEMAQKWSFEQKLKLDNGGSLSDQRVCLFCSTRLFLTYIDLKFLCKIFTLATRETTPDQDLEGTSIKSHILGMLGC